MVEMSHYAAAREAAQQKMADGGVSPLVIEVFSQYFDQLSAGATGLIPEDSIDVIDSVPALAEVEVDPAAARDALDKTVLLKLNGGLGTSMGMQQAKSLLPVRGTSTFLDIIVRQVSYARDHYDVRLPLIFMNSFRTREDTLAHLPEGFGVEGMPLDFLQGREPKLLVDSLEPVSWPADPSLEWCPPGHGDIFTTLADTGLVDQMLDQGYRYLTTANSDNLGAAPNATIAGWFAQSGAEYAPELCRRTLADRKGGHLARRKSDGRTILRDTAQTPAQDMDYFTDVDRHPYFHTNNLWFNLEALRDLLRETGGVVGLPLIRNKKNVDPTDPSSPEVYQVECAMGAIVERFENTQPIVVGRDRFLPVKTTNDLLTVQSDAYELGPDAQLRLATDSAPLVDLDPAYYKDIADFSERFKDIPSLRDAKTFTLRGDWTFTGPLSFSGEVSLEGEGTISSPAGSEHDTPARSERLTNDPPTNQNTSASSTSNGGNT